MATSPQRFSPIPNSQTTSSTDTEPLPKPVRRTYGRAPQRPRSPPPSVLSVIPSTSSSSGLADRFEGNQSRWLKKYTALGTPNDDDEDDVEVDDEQAKEYLLALRTGKDTVPGFGSTSSDLTALPTSSATARVAKTLSETSILTALPPTTDPLSPPLEVNLPLHAQPQEIPKRATQSSPTPSHKVQDDDTLYPPRKVSTARRKIVASSDEDEPSLSPIASSKGKEKATSEEEDDGPAVGTSRKVARIQSSDDEADEDSTPKTAIRPRVSPHQAVHRPRGTTPIAPLKRSTEMDKIFSDDDDPLPLAAKAHKPLKPLPKAERALMEQEMARTRRERQPHLLPKAVQIYPVSTFLANTTARLNSSDRSTRPLTYNTPDLMPARGADPTSSPSIPTPLDDISSFSSVADKAEGDGVQIRGDSSPAARQAKKLHITEVGDDDDLDFKTIDETTQIAKKAKDLDLKRAKLAKIKADAIAAARKPLAPGDDSQDDDDDFEIVEETPQRPTPRPAPPKSSRQLSNVHLMAGVKHRAPKQDLSESYVGHAGRAFGHADTKVRNGARTAVGVSAKKNSAIGNPELNKYLFERAQENAQAIQKQKEDAWGSRRKLADKEALDLAAAEITTDDPAAVREDEDGHEDEADEDFVPEASESEAGEEVEEMDDRPVYSGEEDADMADGDEDDETSEGGNDNKENEPPSPDTDDETTPVARSMRRRNIIRSPSGSPSVSLTQLPVVGPVTEQTSPDGFGSDDGDFSQLFGDTQVDTAVGDGFAALRQQNAAVLLPAHMLLPSNHVSATQIERDNALVAAEADVEAQMAPLDDESQPKYLNKQGFFTQTRPAETQESMSQPVIYPTLTESMEPHSLSDLQYSATYQSPEERSIATQSDSPVRLQRLKRRRTSVESSTEDEAISAEPSPSAPRNAFQVLHEAAQRQPDRTAEQASVLAGFVDQQAEESDEEDVWGDKRKEDDEDDEAEDQDAFVPDLVNDAAVSAAQEEADKVARDIKRREQEAEDEAQRLAAAKNVADGNWKHKKRGFDWDASDDEEESQGRVGRKERRRRRKVIDQVAGVDTSPFQKAYDEGVDSDEGVDDGILEEPAPAARDDAPRPANLTNEQTTRELRRVLAKQKELTAEPVIDLSLEDDGEVPEFTVTKRESQLAPRGAMLPPSKSIDHFAIFLKDNADKGQSTRKAGGASSSVVSAQKTSGPVRGPARAKSTSTSSRRSNSSLGRLDRKHSGFM